MKQQLRIVAFYWPALLAAVVMACATGSRSATSAYRQGPCPLPARDSLGSRLSYTAFVIDGVRIPGSQRVVGGNSHGGAVALDTVPELAALDPGDIHNITVARGPDVELRYGVCPGQAVVLVTTKAAAAAADSAGRPVPTK